MQVNAFWNFSSHLDSKVVNSSTISTMDLSDPMKQVPKMDITLLNQPYTLIAANEESRPSFNDLYRISKCGGGADLDNKLCHFGHGGYCYTFSLDEATSQARGMAHEAVPTDSAEFFLGNKLQILMRNKPCCGRNSPLIILRLCDCKQRCELKTRIDATMLEPFSALLQLSYGEASIFVSLLCMSRRKVIKTTYCQSIKAQLKLKLLYTLVEAGCTEEYQIGKKNEPGNYKHLIYYAFLKRKLLQDIFPNDIFSQKSFTGSPPTIRIIMPQTQIETLSAGDNILQQFNYEHNSLILSSSIKMAFTLLKIGLDHKILEFVATSCRTVMKQIGVGERLHPPDLWKLYGLVRAVNSIEIVVMLRMTIVCALRNILMKKAFRSRVPEVAPPIIYSISNNGAQKILNQGQLQPFRKRCYESGP